MVSRGSAGATTIAGSYVGTKVFEAAIAGAYASAVSAPGLVHKWSLIYNHEAHQESYSYAYGEY